MVLLDFLVRPPRGARLLAERPRWLAPFLILAAIHVALSLVADRQQTDAVLAHLPATAGNAGRSEAAEFIVAGIITRALVQPVRLLAGWSAFAGVMYLLARSLAPRQPLSYMKLFALEVHAEGILALGMAVALARSLAAGSPDLGPFTPAFSMAILSPADAPNSVRALLASLNLFTLWYAAVLAAGTRVLCGVRVRVAVVVAAGSWALSVLFDIGILTLLISALHLRV
ncbi:MAG: hypothetical protein AB1428_04760 [Bacteroidota bacterium]